MVPARGSKIYSILLAHPLTLVREGLAALCQAQTQYRVADQCSDGATALRLIESSSSSYSAVAMMDSLMNLPPVAPGVAKTLGHGVGHFLRFCIHSSYGSLIRSLAR